MNLSWEQLHPDSRGMLEAELVTWVEWLARAYPVIGGVMRPCWRGHPEVARIIEGALDSYSFSGADANRQALASCRSALELLAKEITREDEWRVGLRKLAEGTREKLVGDAHGFLSGYGSHPGGRPTKPRSISPGSISPSARWA